VKIMMMQWARAHFGAGSNVVLGFQPAAGTAGTMAPPRPRERAPQLGWLDRLDAWFWHQEQKRRDAYLAQSADLVELEQRMRQLDRGGHSGFRW